MEFMVIKVAPPSFMVTNSRTSPASKRTQVYGSPPREYRTIKCQYYLLGKHILQNHGLQASVC